MIIGSVLGVSISWCSIIFSERRDIILINKLYISKALICFSLVMVCFSAHVKAETESVTVNAGTRILAKTTSGIDTRSKKAGDLFELRLETNLMSGSDVAVPAGSTLYGKVLKSQRGGIGARKAELELTLTGVQINGQLYPIVTSVLAGEGASGGAGRKIVKAAAIGALADGNSGAETGAKVGAGVAILGGGKHAGVASGSLLEWNLMQPLIVNK